MYYKVGQAVICHTNSGNELLFVKQEFISYISVEDIDGDEIDKGYYIIKRPATQAEILSEAQKHGWLIDKYANYNSPTQNVWFFCHGTLERYVVNADTQQVEDYSIFGNECMVAHRLITALNLAA